MQFSIGDFSKITSLSVKTLRLYHEKGIIIPSVVDEFTNYRYYNEKNIATAQTVKHLRDFEFSLAEIKEILDECNNSDSDILEELQRKRIQIEEKIAKYKNISQTIEKILIIEKEIKMNTECNFEIEEKEVDTILVAGLRMQGKYQDVGEGFKKLGKSFGRYINGKPINLYYDSEYKDDAADFEPCFPIKKGTSTDDIVVRELKGGKCVSLIHKGPYDHLSSSYSKILNYINEKNYKTKLPTREVYLKGPGMIFKGNPNNYLTEIQMFIEE